MYLAAASTISYQHTFQQPGFVPGLRPLTPDSKLIQPDYQAFIPVKESRRLNDVLKMAIACSADCLAQAGLEQPEAIIVGTSMGCNHFTKTFLDKIIEAGEGLISPTSFMLSTHNTIAGQVSLFLGNRQHNMTHTQNSLSFEQALLDAILCLEEGRRHVLVGAADEMQNDLYNMHARLENEKLLVACGASFFILAAERPDAASLQLVDVGSFGLVDNIPRAIQDFLASNGRTAADTDLVLYASSQATAEQALRVVFPLGILTDYQQFSGAYYTNAAFALHYAVDRMRNAGGNPVKNVLICNNLIPENLGLILISR